MGKYMSRREYAIKTRCDRWGVKYEKVSRAQVFKRDSYICQLCQEPIPKGRERKRFPHPLTPSLDHIIPVSRGGNHTFTNLQAAHLRCNILKSNKTEDVE